MNECNLVSGNLKASERVSEMVKNVVPSSFTAGEEIQVEGSSLVCSYNLL